MVDRLLLFAIFVADGAVYSWLSLLAMLLFAKHRRLAVLSGGVGVGPTLFCPRILGVTIRVKLIPISSFILPHPAPYVGADSQQTADALAARVEAGEVRGYDEFSLPERVGFVSLTVAVALVIAVVAVGPSVAQLALADLRTIARGAAGPFSVAPAALDAALARLHTHGIASSAARLSSVMLASQAFTMGNLQFLLRDRTSSLAKRAGQAATMLILIGLPITVMWSLACVVWLFR